MSGPDRYHQRDVTGNESLESSSSLQGTLDFQNFQASCMPMIIKIRYTGNQNEKMQAYLQ